MFESVNVVVDELTGTDILPQSDLYGLIITNWMVFSNQNYRVLLDE
jgi:hypothetical protein